MLAVPGSWVHPILGWELQDTGEDPHLVGGSPRPPGPPRPPKSPISGPSKSVKIPRQCAATNGFEMVLVGFSTLLKRCQKLVKDNMKTLSKPVTKTKWLNPVKTILQPCRNSIKSLSEPVTKTKRNLNGKSKQEAGTGGLEFWTKSSCSHVLVDS